MDFNIREIAVQQGEGIEGLVDGWKVWRREGDVLNDEETIFLAMEPLLHYLVNSLSEQQYEITVTKIEVK